MLTKLLGSYSGYLHTVLYIVFGVLSIPYLLTFTPLEYIGWMLFGFIFVGFLVSAFQHRYCSHRSWNMPRWLEVMFVVFSAGFMLAPSIIWATFHRQHHRYADREGDPHGWFNGFWSNLLVYNNTPPMKMIPKWMLRDKLYTFQFQWYWEIAIVFAILSYTVGLFNFWMSVIAISYVVQVSLNMIGHSTELKTVDRPWLAWMYGGETYHKYHHDNPMNPRFGLIDIPYITLIKWFDNDTKRSKRNSDDLGKTA